VTVFTRRRVAELAADALRRAGVDGVLPTALDAVRAAAGLEIVGASLGAGVLGAYWFEERAVFVDRGQSEPRQRFTEAHETIHALCPWHRATLMLDDEDTLSGRVRDQLEAEANYGAAHLIFQGGRFVRDAAAEPVSVAVPLALAERYGASRHAALLHYAEEHPEPVALLVLGRWPGADGVPPVWRCVASPAFRARFGPQAGALASLPAIADLLDEARRSQSPPSTRLALRDRGGTPRLLHAEAYSNRRCLFLLVAAPLSALRAPRARRTA
jgi:hypothetical protein